MGKLTAFYRLSLLLYPADFRRRYGEPMLQTMADMMADEPTLLGKIRLGLRLCIDAQQSIVKENVTHKGDFIMQTQNKFIVAGFLLVVALIGSALLPLIRRIGMDWRDVGGMLRVLVLLGFLIAFIIVPACLALVSLFVNPLQLLRKKTVAK